MTGYRNLLEWAYHWERTAPDRVFLTQPLGGGAERVRDSTFREVLDQARRMATYLQAQGLPPRSQVAICSKNCAHWIMADLAVWMAGHVSVPVFPVLTPELVRYTLEHSESRLLFLGKVDPVWTEMAAGVPPGLPVVAFPLAPPNAHVQWDDVVASHPPLQHPVERAPEELATIIYTSGSTGVPKGVMHSFGAMLACTMGLLRVLHGGPEDRYLSYLPIAHGMERWLGECLPLAVGNRVYYAESAQTFLQDLRRASPTMFMSVPRLWVKFQAGVLAKLPPRRLALLLKIPLVRTLVKRRIVHGLGLGQVRFAGSGSAPIPREVLEWFRALGVELLEGYGMTENFNYSHLTRPGEVRTGYVGPPYADVECRLAEDGEIQVKGPGTMMGYFKMPAETREAITADGFLRTGDQGEVDELNRLRITGRTKEIFKTAKGKYIAPAPIENMVVNHPSLELCCVLGSGRGQPHAVVQLSEAAEGQDRERLTRELAEHLAAVNARLLSHEKLHFLAVVGERWSPENGFLTPTLKVRRARLEQAYAPLAPAWEAAGRPVIFHP